MRRKEIFLNKFQKFSKFPQHTVCKYWSQRDEIATTSIPLFNWGTFLLKKVVGIASQLFYHREITPFASQIAGRDKSDEHARRSAKREA